MIVAHMPEDGSGANAYGRLFREALERQGHKAVPLPARLVFIPGLLANKVDAVQFEFIDAFFLPHSYRPAWLFGSIKAVFFVTQIFLLRLLGVRLFWTVHHPGNYEGQLAWLERLVNWAFARLGSGLIAPGEAAADDIARQFGLGNRKRVHVCPHPNYIGAYADEMSREEARTDLGISSETAVFLCFGQIRGYKRLLEAADAFLKVPERSENAELWIVGSAKDEALLAELQTRAADCPQVRLVIRHVPDDEVQLFFKAADFVVQNYEIPSSGATVLAMSFGKPVIVPRSRYSEERLDGAGAYLFDSEQDDGFAAAIANASVQLDRAAAMGQHNREKVRQWGWDAAAARLVDIYQSK